MEYLIGGVAFLIAALGVRFFLQRLARETEAARFGPTISDLVGTSIGTPDPTRPAAWVPEAAPAPALDRGWRRNPFRNAAIRRDRSAKENPLTGAGRGLALKGANGRSAPGRRP
jgi:hypothetical protein